MRLPQIVLKAKAVANIVPLKKVFYYSLFFLIALACFLYARFPSELLAPIMEKNFSSDPFKVSITRVTLSFPPGVYLEGVSVSRKSPTGVKALVEAISVSYRPSIFRAMMGEGGGSLVASLLGGKLYVKGATDGGANKKIAMEFGFEDIDPGLSPLWEEVPWGKVSGRLDGEGKVSIIDQDIFRGSGELTANLSQGTFTVGKIISSDRRKVKLDEAIIELKYKLGKVTINRAEIHGEDMDIWVTGDIIAFKRPEFSRLNLDIAIKLSGKLKQKFDPLLAFFKKDNDGKSIIHIGGMARAPSIR